MENTGLVRLASFLNGRCGENLYLGFLWAYLELAAESRDMLDKILQICGENEIEELVRNHGISLSTLLHSTPEPYISSLTSLLERFYSSHFHLFPYTLFPYGESNHSHWILHGLATLFDIGIRVIYREKIDGKLNQTYIYPDTETRYVRWVYLYTDMLWDWSRESLEGRNCDMNIWPLLRDLYSINAVSALRQLINQSQSLFPAFQFPKQFGLILCKTLTHMHRQINCARCAQASSLCAPCGHSYCQTCISANVHFTCTLCPNSCFRPDECRSNSLIRVENRCLGCEKWFPLAEKYPGDPSLQSIHRLFPCGHTFCSFCLEVKLRSPTATCPLCPAPLPMSLKDATEVQCVCSLCGESKEWLANFDLVVCRDHRICSFCIAGMETTDCPLCNKPFLSSFSPATLNFNTIRCSSCSELTLFADLYRSTCKCEICVNCLFSTASIGRCAKCGCERSPEEVLEVYKFVGNRWRNIDLPAISSTQ